MVFSIWRPRGTVCFLLWWDAWDFFPTSRISEHSTHIPVPAFPQPPPLQPSHGWELTSHSGGACCVYTGGPWREKTQTSLPLVCPPPPSSHLHYAVHWGLSLGESCLPESATLHLGHFIGLLTFLCASVLFKSIIPFSNFIYNPTTCNLVTFFFLVQITEITLAGQVVSPLPTLPQPWKGNQSDHYETDHILSWLWLDL